MVDDDRGKSALIAELAAQRARLSRHAEGVRESVDVGARMRASFAENRVAWLAGAAFAGIVLVRLGRRGGGKAANGSAPLKAAAGAGILLPLVKVAIDIARPALVSLATARIADFAARQGRPRRGV